jgi:hypothetical protein
MFPDLLPSGAPWETDAAAFVRRSAAMSKVPFQFWGTAWQGRTGLESRQMLALISVYAPVVIIIVAVVAVLVSFFWVFLPLPRWMSNAMGRLLVRWWRWRERRRW